MRTTDLAQLTKPIKERPVGILSCRHRKILIVSVCGNTMLKTEAIMAIILDLILWRFKTLG